MAVVDIVIAGRHYGLHCRDGEEAHLRTIAGLVDAKALDAARSMGGLSEVRQLLFAALLLADELADLRAGAMKAAPAAPAPAAPPPAESPAESNGALATALERLAERMEKLASRVETAPPSA